MNAAFISPSGCPENGLGGTGAGPRRRHHPSGAARGRRRGSREARLAGPRIPMTKNHYDGDSEKA